MMNTKCPVVIWSSLEWILRRSCVRNCFVREGSTNLNWSVRLWRPDRPNVFVWGSAGTRSGWGVIKICKHGVTRQTRQLLPQPSSDAFLSCSGRLDSACKSVKHCDSLQPAQRGRLILPLLLLLLLLLFSVQIDSWVLSHATCTVLQKGAVTSRPASHLLFRRAFSFTSLAAQRLFDRWPSGFLDWCVCLCQRSSKQ